MLKITTSSLHCSKPHVIRRAFAPIAEVQASSLIMLLGVAVILMKMGVVATVQYLNQYKHNVADVRQQVTCSQSMAYNGRLCVRCGIRYSSAYIQMKPNSEPKYRIYSSSRTCTKPMLCTGRQIIGTF